jgi:pyrimidine-specific ribonucleoside hydrolase
MRNMNLIIETDLGNDPDDFFAILWLISVGVNIRAVTIVPGSPEQIAIAQAIRKECGLDFPIGNGKSQKTGVVNVDVLRKYFPKRWEHLWDGCNGHPDAEGHKVVEKTLEKYPDCELFVIGPCTNLGKYIQANPQRTFTRATMQGGFCGYELHWPNVQLDKFQGLKWCPTFNLNGDRPRALAFLNAKITDRRMIGKNVCHTIVYDKETHAQLKPKDRASELFKEGMDLYLTKHEGKKFHDPSAAVAHLYPEIVTWIRGKTVKMESGWGTEPDENGDHIAVDIDRQALWNHILNFI